VSQLATGRKNLGMGDGPILQDKLRAGDRATLERVYREHKDRLLTLAAALTGDRQAAEDVVHDVFQQVIKDGAHLRENRNLHAYLSVCTRNRAIDVVRRRRTRRLAGAEAGSQLKVDDPVEQATETEETVAVLRAVNELPPEQREAISLHVWGDLPFEEIGRLQGISKGAAYARYRKALEILRTKLRSDSDG
jgi:RNA polymerase sigma factor (sigma-70 family)